jgi:hypothetical protein
MRVHDVEVNCDSMEYFNVTLSVLHVQMDFNASISAWQPDVAKHSETYGS